MDDYNDAFGYLFTQRVNIEVLLLADADGLSYINLRARPWKNSPQDGYMLLVGAHMFEDALLELAEAHESGKWQRLDWTRRVGPLASPPQNVRQFPTASAPGAPEQPQEGRYVPKSYKEFNDRLKGR